MSNTTQTTQTDQAALEGKRIAVIGYGSQGRGQSLNLRDSGMDVVLGLREGGKTWKQAEEDGWKPMKIEEAVSSADLVCLLCPDMQQPKLYSEQVAPNLKKDAAVLFSHGFNILYGSITVAEGHDVIMVAPKGPGAIVRREYENGFGVPCLIAVSQDASGTAEKKCLAYADATGCGRAGVMKTTFKEETETDLFGEQAVLCGGLAELVKAGWETLVEAGYAPEVAYFECLHEMKLIVDLIYEGGLAGMHKFISDTAKYGALVSGPRVVTDETRQRMREILKDIQDGKFAKQWQDEFNSGETKYRQMLNDELKHNIEDVGQDIRKHFSWLAEKQNASTPKMEASAQ